jgi:hypothetical protein
MITKKAWLNLAVLLFGLTIAGLNSASSQDLCACGPDYCLNDPRYPKALAGRKSELRKAGFGEDLIALLDQDGKCFAAVDKGPETFFIKRMIDGKWDVSELNSERESYAKEDILAGKTTVYYKFNTNHALDCCKQPKFDARSDYDRNLDLNLGLALVCRKSRSSVVCARGH